VKSGDLGAHRLAAEHGVTRALAGARSLEEAAPGILEAICGSLGWDAGAFWQRDSEEGDLFCVEVWYARSELRSFEEVTSRTRFALGKGLPGRVWDTHGPVWLRDLASDSHMVRRELSAVLGLRTALAFPVLVEHEVLGVLEFFSQRPAEPDEPLLGMMEAIGSEIGQFVKRTRAEAALRESEERLRIALEAGRMGTWDWDILAGRLRWSEGLERIYGFPPGGFGGTLGEFLGAIHPDDREELTARITADLEERREHHGEFRILRPDGSLRWIEASGQILLDEAGRPVRMVGVSADVTERKRVEEALRLLAEANSVLAVSLDPEEVFQGVARLTVPVLADFCFVDVIERGTMRRVAAVHADSGRDELMREAQGFPPDPETQKDHPVIRAIRSGEIQLLDMTEGSSESLARSSADRALLERLGPCSILSAPLVARGKTRGAITLIRYGSGRRHRPWDVELARELARRVTLAVDNLYLYHATRQAVRARDQVLAVVSHDLRNLLDPISMNAAQLLEDTPAGSLARRPLERIRRAVEQMDRLIRDLLDVASIEAGRLVLAPEPIDPADLVAEALECHRPAAERKSRRLVGAVPPDLPTVEGDRYRLLQVFTNLVGNALKFTPLEGTVTVGAERFGAGEVRFFVADTGPGILEEDLPHLFEAYWKSPSHREPGSGLGLAICERIVTAHGGRIWVESEPGAGSVFSFTLGRRPPPAEPVPLPSPGGE
jgi:PAS domain S-box-containing protein